MSSSSTTLTLEQQQPHLFLGDQLCYLHCHKCDTVLAVSVPSTSLFKTVTVRCGQCTNLLPLNVCRMKIATQSHYNRMDMIQTPIFNQGSTCTFEGNDHLRLPYKSIASVINRTPEKRQRVPSAYNRFIKDEIQRIKAGNPDISHREAFSAAAKNVWGIFFLLFFLHYLFLFIIDTAPGRHSTSSYVVCRQEELPYRILMVFLVMMTVGSFSSHPIWNDTGSQYKNCDMPTNEWKVSTFQFP